MDTQPITCPDVPAFMEYLSLSHPLWKDAFHKQFAFRGQGDSRWGLTPKAFRSKITLGYGPNAIEPSTSRPELQARAEYEAVRAFVEIADAVGLTLPGDLHSFRGLTEMPITEADKYWKEKWPEPDVLELLAIAQHHGVPTRLLDFTYQPLVAAFFAATGCLERQKASESDPPKAFAVWAVDLRFVRQLWSRESRSRERMREVVVARAGNDFLRAQDGLFLLDTRANERLDGIAQIDLAQVFAQSADYWLKRKGAWPDGSPGTKYVLPAVKIEVPAQLAKDTVSYLHRVGITMASIFPSHDGVVNALNFMKKLGLPIG